MKTTVNEYQFIQAFQNMNRGEQFSHEGLKALYGFLDMIESETGVETELDVIALCCEFAEYASIKDFQHDYGEEYQTIGDIEDMTLVIPVDEESFIIQQF